MIGAILEPTIFLVVWSTVAESRGGDVGGYTASEFAAYYIVLMMVNHFTFSWIMQVFQFRIQFGSLSYELLRPVHPIHADIMDNIAFKLVQLTLMIPAMIIHIILFDPAFDFRARDLMLAVPVILLAFIVRFFLEWALALAAFWTTRTVAINNMYFLVMMFVSGRIAPIALLPIWLQETARVLPFYYVVAFPAELINGSLSDEQILNGIMMLMVWLVLAWVIMQSLWRVSVKSFSAVGG